MNPLSLKRVRLALPFALLAVAFHAASAAEVTWVGTANGDWTTGSNWSTSPALPANNGTDVLNFHFGSATTRTTGMNGNWDVLGLIGSSGAISGNSTLRIVAGALSGVNPAPSVSGTLKLGTDGIKIRPGSTGQVNLELGSTTVPTNLLTVETTGNQTWETSAPTGNVAGRITVAADLAGSGVISVQSGTGSNTGELNFTSGSSTNFNGSFTLRSGRLVLNGSSQIDRLGPNALTIVNANPGAGSGNSNSNLALSNLSATTQTFANAINFVDAGTGKDNRISVESAAAGAEELIWAGNWSGAMASQLIMRQTANRTLLQRIQGNNSGLTSSFGEAIALWSGRYVLESNNAFGAGNTISVRLGGENLNGAGSYNSALVALYAKDGVTVNSAITTAQGNQWGYQASLGILESGTANFTGPITLSNGAASGTGTAVMQFIATTGGRANFTGAIGAGQLTAPYKVPVIARGGGTVALSGNNTYHGTTSVIEGTTLLINGITSGTSATGSFYVGFAGQNFTGDTTANTLRITGLSSTAGLAAGMQVSGAGIAAGTFITWVGANEIGISALTTATASGVTITGAAETGILGGTGIVRPGTGAFVSVAAGSQIAPGDGGIGTLTFDGVNTSAALLTLDSGAEFTFQLGAANASDKVSFWNYAAGDFVLNSNVINFTGAQEGTYTLFDFYSNAGTTAAISGITTGLVIGTGLDGFNYTLNYNVSSITLDLTVVPEPGTLALISLGGLAFALCGRRRRDC